MSDDKADKAAAPATADDDVKRQYREALDRKKAGHSGGGHAEGDSKVHDAHGPAKAQRQFRRKAGG